MLNTIDEAYDWLFSQRNPIKDKELIRIRKLISDLDLYPNYKIILITGTNGKGSTANYLKDILKNTGRHVGLFQSPYVDIFNERIMINDRYISNAEIMHYTNILYNISNKYDECIPFFELVFLMSLMYYKDRNIDLGIFEVGIGGLYDITNVLDPEISIITNIGYDHTNILGNTKEEIANHKLGITRENKVCLSTEIDISEYLDAYCSKNNIIYKNIYEDINIINVADKTIFKYKDTEYTLSMLGEYQAYNAALAIEAALYIDNNIPYDLIKYSLIDSKLPGRFEKLSNNIILDGAHNISAIIELTKQIQNYKNITCVFAALADKDYKEMLKCLDNVVESFIFVKIDDRRAIEPKEFIKYINKKYIIFNDIDELINHIEIKTCETILITGSLHFISQIRKVLIF